MRVVAGTARSLKLETIDSLDTRPTTDRIKETLFNILAPNIPECMFLDLFAGSGAIGIEALSRGAKQAFFVEQNKKAVDCINKNLIYTHLKDGADVITGDCLCTISSLERKKIIFDIIFMDPPYGRLLEKQVLSRLANSSVLDENTMIIVESDLETGFSYADELGFEVYREKKYKTNKHTFLYRRA